MEIKTSVFRRKSGRKSGSSEKLFGKGLWVARIRYVDPEDGLWHSREKTAATKGEACDLRDKEVQRLKATQKPSGIRRGEKLTFGEFADECLLSIYAPAELDSDGYKLSGSKTHEKAKSFITQLKKVFGERQLASISEKDLISYRVLRLKPRDEKTRAVSHTTVNRELAHFSRIWTEAIDFGLVTHSPFTNRKRVFRLDREKKRQRILSEAEEQRLLKACGGTYKAKYIRVLGGKEQETDAIINLGMRNPALRALVITAIETGCRQGELFKLKWSDLDFDENKALIHGTHTKTEMTRYVPLTERAIRELEHCRATIVRLQAKGKALHRDPEQPFAFDNVKRSFKRACELAKIDGLHFHDLRRTAVSRWQAAGIPLAVAQKWAGHSNSKMTAEVYTAVASEMHEEFVDRLNNREAARPRLRAVS
jgi:integrase